jgi:hypothetical protein
MVMQDWMRSSPHQLSCVMHAEEFETLVLKFLFTFSFITFWLCLVKTSEKAGWLYLYTDVSTVLFIITNKWTQPRCSSIGEWINILQNPDNTIFFSDEKRSAMKSQKDQEEPLIHTAMPSSITTYCTVIIMWHSENGKTITLEDQWIPGGGEKAWRGEIQRTFLGQWKHCDLMHAI